jgi:hypothetical protein
VDIHLVNLAGGLAMFLQMLLIAVLLLLLLLLLLLILPSLLLLLLLLLLAPGLRRFPSQSVQRLSVTQLSRVNLPSTLSTKPESPASIATAFRDHMIDSSTV